MSSISSWIVWLSDTDVNIIKPAIEMWVLGHTATDWFTTDFSRTPSEAWSNYLYKWPKFPIMIDLFTSVTSLSNKQADFEFLSTTMEKWDNS